MRIVSGLLRGRQINPPSNFTARPTTDYAKESLFNILNNRVDFEEIKVLDLFSGTGSIAMEFASRGATIVYAVEMNRKYCQFIDKTVKGFGLANLKVLNTDAFRYLDKNQQAFDVVFADPPYDLEGLDLIPDRFFKGAGLTPDGWFILEHSSKSTFKSHPRFVELRTYGKVNFSFFQ
jgi:16S rRNA (guanine966-N2)-methyltransferase